jgi:hypothetical protein
VANNASLRATRRMGSFPLVGIVFRTRFSFIHAPVHTAGGGKLWDDYTRMISG